MFNILSRNHSCKVQTAEWGTEFVCFLRDRYYLIAGEQVLSLFSAVLTCIYFIFPSQMLPFLSSFFFFFYQFHLLSVFIVQHSQSLLSHILMKERAFLWNKGKQNKTTEVLWICYFRQRNAPTSKVIFYSYLYVIWTTSEGA